MCQLIFVHLNNKNMNLITTELLAIRGANGVHDDGTGYMYQGKWNKSAMAADSITNLGEWMLHDVVGAYPIACHVRQATYGIAVSKENAHPFESKDYILMHNGTLIKAGEKKIVSQAKSWNTKIRDWEGGTDDVESDSKVFLEALQENTSKGKSFVDIFNETMSGFWGKFAFIIYHKKEKTYYVIKGKTAGLFIQCLKDEDGFIINTDKENLNKLHLTISDINQVINKTRLEFNAPMELEDNTIYKLDDKELVDVGKCKENIERDFAPAVEEKPKTNAIVPTTAKSDTEPSLSKDMAKFMNLHFLAPKDMGYIFELLMQKSLFSASDDDIELFVTKVIPEIKANNSIIKFLKKNLNRDVFPSAIYFKEEYGIKYPWFLNNQQDVVKAVKKYNTDSRVNVH